MDLVKRVMKVQANKNYKKGWFFVCNLIFVYALTGSSCSLFRSYPFRFSSSLSCCVKEFLFIHLPYIWSSFSEPKWLFVVANVIIVVLVGESNFVGSNSSSSAGDQYYDEYVERSKRLGGHASSYNNTLQEKKEEVDLIYKESEDQVDEVVKEEVIKEQEKEVEIEKDDDKEEEEEEEVGLPAQELNKRIEEFIARVNKQRWLEAKSLVCCRAYEKLNIA